jgi:hypothetical protein
MVQCAPCHGADRNLLLGARLGQHSHFYFVSFGYGAGEIIALAQSTPQLSIVHCAAG